MFDRFTEQARKAITLSQDIARAAHYPEILPEHFLLAFLRLPQSAAGRSLHALHIREAHIGEVCPASSGANSPQEDIPFAPEAKEILEQSLREALKRKDTSVSTGDMLLAMISGNLPSLGQVFKSLAIRKDQATKLTLSGIGLAKEYLPGMEPKPGGLGDTGITQVRVMQVLNHLLADAGVRQRLILELSRQQPQAGLLARSTILELSRLLRSDQLDINHYIRQAVALREIHNLLQRTRLLSELNPWLPTAMRLFVDHCFDEYRRSFN